MARNRTVALGMAVMAVGLVLFARIGASATFTSLLPGFILFGLGAGLLNVPLTNAVLEGAPVEQAGIASALLNASREVAGLLGVTVIGAILRAREGAALRSGSHPAQAFLDGYHTGLWVTIGLMAAGVVLSYLALRPRRTEAGPGPVSGAPPRASALEEAALEEAALEVALVESAAVETAMEATAGGPAAGGSPGDRAAIRGPRPAGGH